MEVKQVQEVVDDLQLIKPKQTARILGVTPEHLARLAVAGLIEFVNLGFGQERIERRYTLDGIRNFIRSRMNPLKASAAGTGPALSAGPVPTRRKKSST